MSIPFARLRCIENAHTDCVHVGTTGPRLPSVSDGCSLYLRPYNRLPAWHSQVAVNTGDHGVKKILVQSASECLLCEWTIKTDAPVDDRRDGFYPARRLLPPGSLSACGVFPPLLLSRSSPRVRAWPSRLRLGEALRVSRMRRPAPSSAAWSTRVSTPLSRASRRTWTMSLRSTFGAYALVAGHVGRT